MYLILSSTARFCCILITALGRRSEEVGGTGAAGGTVAEGARMLEGRF